MAIVQLPPNETIPGGARWPDGVSLLPYDLSLMESALQSLTVSLSSAQILALNTTPVTLVPAQGANTIVFVDEILLEMTRTATAYASGGALEFRYTNGSGAKVTADIAASVVTTGGAGVEYNTVGGVVTSLTPVVNAPIVIDNATGAFTTGTGTARIWVKFRIVSTAASFSPTR